MESREQIINNFYIDIKPCRNYIDIYYVRKSILQALKKNLQNFKGELLDVGCGVMPYREVILRNKKVSSYIGLDFENSLDPEYALGKPDIFWKGDIIPLEDNSVGTIIATELFEHCPYPESVMQEMLRVLKPGGVLFFTVPFLWNLHLVPHDEYRYTPFSLQRLLTSSGFKSIELEALGGWDASLAQMIGIWIQRRPHFRFKGIISRLLVVVIKKLVKLDARFDKRKLFDEGCMITGIAGIAYK